MHDAWITSLHRVENHELFQNFQLQQLRLQHTVNKGKGGAVLMAEAWHGTGNFPAENIYEDRQAGFLMQYASKGQLSVHSHRSFCICLSSELLV